MSGAVIALLHARRRRGGGTYYSVNPDPMNEKDVKCLGICLLISFIILFFFLGIMVIDMRLSTEKITAWDCTTYQVLVYKDSPFQDSTYQLTMDNEFYQEWCTKDSQ